MKYFIFEKDDGKNELKGEGRGGQAGSGGEEGEENVKRVETFEWI